jgi:hypothetical protein
MKKVIRLLFFTVVLLSSCTGFDLGNLKSSSTLGGNTDIPINIVGNTFSPLGVSIDGSYVNLDPSIVITNSVDGVNTIQVKVDLGKDPALSSINELIPDELKDSQGKVSFETKVKITSDGWLDYSNVDKEPVVLVKYNCSVGDKYSVTTSSGTKIEREVTSKSTTDDYEYGFYNIKVIKVEQKTTFPGISKYVGYFNHKFGLVGIELITDDGSVLKMNMGSKTY